MAGRIVFPHQDKIRYHCNDCNDYVDIQDLVEFLKNYGLYDSPNDYYQAWKILRLGTTEYVRKANRPCLEHKILQSAVKKLQEVGTNDLDDSKDSVLDEDSSPYSDTGQLNVSVIAYADGPPKLQIGPRTYYKDDELFYRKAGRLSRDELQWIIGLVNGKWNQYFG